MDRREILGAVLQASLSFLVLPSTKILDVTTQLPLLIKNIPPGFDVVSLGNDYLRSLPRCFNRETFVNCESKLWAGRKSCADPKIASEILASLIAKDFDTNATVRIGGWIFARVELELCALHSSFILESR